MITYSMESVLIPRPPALPLGPLVPSRGGPLPPLPPPPKPLHDVEESTTTTTMCQMTTTRNFESGDKKVHEERNVLEERRITQKMIEKKITRNESVRSKMSSVTSQNGFRLNGGGSSYLHPQNDDAGSVYSLYKQKIDSMFESDSSVGGGGGTTSNHNSVQAKIEKMFSDVAKDSGISANQMGVHAFSIDYLGSVPLQDKVTSLAGLQTPLKDLYFSYKKIIRNNKKVLSGRLEISSQGLRVQYQGPKGDLEQMNSFPTIAVWSAVKFVIQENSSMLHGKGAVSYAFLPLITDPDNMDKQMLFKILEDDDKKFIMNQQHSPLFAVVMRKIGVQKQLECHGFVCQTSEDAIVIAATLYKALVNHMKNKERKPKNKNGLTTCMSTASSTAPVEKNVPVRPPRRKRSSAASSVCSDTNVSDTQPLLPPSKPVKKSTKSRKAPEVPIKSEDLNAIVPYEEPTFAENEETPDEIKPKSFSDKLSVYMSKEQKEIAAEIKQVVSDSTRGLKRVKSIRKPSEEAVRNKENSGDIFTKVTIPRSGSFLNTSGLTKYKNKTSRNNESASGGSPLGFKEIFHELSMQEGLHSMDDILSVIIDPDGMSFNDLKPIYKEFLLKLALTLTKDELYLKSKSIMRRQRRKTFRKVPAAKKAPSKLVTSKFKRLKHIFQKNFKSKQLIENTGNNRAEIRSPNNMKNEESKMPESSISTSSYDTRPFRPKEETTSKRTSYKKKTHGDFNKRRDRTSTSEESDFFSLKRQNKYNRYQNINGMAGTQNRNSSSGYVSCSECSYDSDTCTCVSADKCYCSLGQKSFNGVAGSRRNSFHSKCVTSTVDPSLTYCECDTDSCAESNKCYCQYGTSHKHHAGGGGGCTSRSHQKDFIRHHHLQHKKLCKNNSNTKSTRSLEYMSNPCEGYYERLKSKQKFGSERLFHPQYSVPQQKSRRNSHGGMPSTMTDIKIIGLQNMQMDYDWLGKHADLAGLQEAIRNEGKRFGELEYWKGAKPPAAHKVQSAITTGACTEALSVKKSAEIAAMFADIKLSQTTDIAHLGPTPGGYMGDVDRRNVYNSEKSLQAKYSKPLKGPLAIGQKSSSGSHYGRPISKGKMYSAKNGLYTIQSQSDDSKHSGSRKSSFSGETRGRKPSEYSGNRRNIVSSNMENSLGYLP